MDKKSIYEVAVEASEGLYGTGSEKDSIIEYYGYNPKRVQKIINRGLKYGFSEYKILGASASGSSSDSDKKETLTVSVATAKDGTHIEFSDKKDLAEKVKELFENEKYKNTKESNKYVYYFVKDSNTGKLKRKEMTYKQALEYIEKNMPETDNDNNESWDKSGESSGSGDSSGGSSDSSGGSDNSGGSSGEIDSESSPKPSGRGTNNPTSHISFYIKNMLNEKIIYLPVHPEEVSESFSTNYSQTELNGRSAPYQTYGGNEARTISLAVTLHQDLCDETTGDLQMIVMYLKQLVYPKYNGSIVIPPYCFLKFGNMLNCYAIMDSIDFNWSETIIEESKYYSKCEVNFSFQELRKNSLPTVDNVFKDGRDIDS